MCLPHEEQSKSDVVTQCEKHIRKKAVEREKATKHVHNPMY